MARAHVPTALLDALDAQLCNFTTALGTAGLKSINLCFKDSFQTQSSLSVISLRY